MQIYVQISFTFSTEVAHKMSFQASNEQFGFICYIVCLKLTFDPITVSENLHARTYTKPRAP